MSRCAGCQGPATPGHAQCDDCESRYVMTDGPMSRDSELSSGYHAGNYAAAYETTDYSEAVAKLSMNRSEAYLAAFTLGFFVTYEPSEMGEHEQAYRDALASDAGQRCIELGYFTPNVRTIPAGTRVSVLAHTSLPGKGLTYPAMTVTLVDPCETEGWDVIDARSDTGEEISVYSFSVKRDE